MSITPQTGILLPVPAQARYLTFTINQADSIAACLSALQKSPHFIDGEKTVMGIGQGLASVLGTNIPGLKHADTLTAPGLSLEKQAEVLWLWLRGEDRGELLHRSRTLCRLLAPAFSVESITEGFRHLAGHDLSGFEDGTENPVGDDALAAAIVEKGNALAGSSFVAIQQWKHDLERFDAMASHAQNHMIGRDRQTNEELDDAPLTAHVKRTAQESFSPEAFVLRRSMPWAEGFEAGLIFVAFGCSLAAFEAQLRRMTGQEDGQVDQLFSFTRPLSTGYFWCPPRKNGIVDLSLLGL